MINNSKNNKRQQNILKRYPTGKRNIDTMKLLATSSLFQQIIKDTRKFLDIKEDGLKDPEAWTEKMSDRSDDIIESEEYKKQIDGIRDKLNKEEINLSTAKKQSELLGNTKLPWNYLSHAVEYIIKKFRLPAHFDYQLRQYIFFGQINAPLDNYGINLYPDPKKKSYEQTSVQIKVYAPLTDKELTDIKKIVNKVISKRVCAYGDIKDLDTTIELDKWNKSKERYNEAEDKKYKITAKEISENVIGNKKNGQKVYDSTRRLKKLRIKRFGTE